MNKGQKIRLKARRSLHHVLIVFMLMFSVVGESRQASDFPWLAAGDWRGHIEPCGCDPSTDLGGVLRFADFVAKERAINPSLSLFVLGNIVGNKLVEDGLEKSRLLLRTVAKVKPSAVLFNEGEQIAWSTVKVLRKELKNLPFVASHLRKQAEGNLIAEFRESENAIVLGYAYQGKSILLQPLSQQIIRRWKKILGKAPRHKTKVLLFSGSDRELQSIRNADLFDLILRSSPEPFESWDIPIDRNESKLFVSSNDERVDVRLVPLAGRGVLRGGVLTRQVAPSLSKALSGIDQKCSNLSASCFSKHKNLFSRTRVTWLTRDYAGVGLIDDLYEDYRQSATRRFSTWSMKRAKHLADSKYVGSKTCMTCHPKAYEVWEKSGHSHAYDILIKQGKHQDLSCIGCHVLGYEEKGGFSSFETSPQFAHVQCENCHGPRKEHVGNPSAHKGLSKADANSCKSCHQGEHSPQFRYEDYWPKIKHGQG